MKLVKKKKSVKKKIISSVWHFRKDFTVFTWMSFPASFFLHEHEEDYLFLSSVMPRESSPSLTASLQAPCLQYAMPQTPVAYCKAICTSFTGPLGAVSFSQPQVGDGTQSPLAPYFLWLYDSMTQWIRYGTCCRAFSTDFHPSASSPVIASDGKGTEPYVLTPQFPFPELLYSFSSMYVENNNHCKRKS